MNKFEVINNLRIDLLKIKEDILLAKEPNESDSDIDVFITNRSKLSFSYLIKNSKLPIIFTAYNRGFAFYLAKSGLMKPIDLFDTYSIKDKTIDWFLSRSNRYSNKINIKILRTEDQLSMLIYKLIDKSKYKKSRIYKILILKLNCKKHNLINSFNDICKLQKQSSKFIEIGNNIIEILYGKNNLVEEEISNILDLNKRTYENRGLFKKITKSFLQNVKFIKNEFFLFKHKRNIPILSFVGIDGSGKTTTISELKISLIKLEIFLGKVETKTLFSVWSKLYKKLIQVILERIIIKTNKYNLFFLNTFFKSLKNYLYSLIIYKDAIKKFNNFLKYSKKCKLVIVDRWWIDFLIPKKNHKYFVNKKIFDKFINLPVPDLFIYLDTPLEICIQRRECEDKNILRYKSATLNNILETNFQNIIRIDGSKEISDNIKIIHKGIYESWISKNEKL